MFVFLFPLIKSFHCKLNALAFVVDAEHAHTYMLVHADDCCRVADKLVGKLGDMHQSVFLDPYIYEASEISNIIDDAGQFHTFPQVVDGLHVFVELEDLNLLTRVTSRFIQFLHDIGQRRQSHGIGHIVLDIYLAAQVLVLIRSSTEHFKSFAIFSTIA